MKPPLLTQCLVLVLATWFSACGGAASAGRALDAAAESYVRLVLALAERDADSLDIYYGPSAWEDDNFGVHFAFFGSTTAETRIRILEGQMRGLEKMVENEDYCMDIITQSRAIQRSLESLNRLLLENHLRTHVTDMFEAGGEERDKAVVELLKAFDFDRK